MAFACKVVHRLGANLLGAQVLWHQKCFRSHVPRLNQTDNLLTINLKFMMHWRRRWGAGQRGGQFDELPINHYTSDNSPSVDTSYCYIHSTITYNRPSLWKEIVQLTRARSNRSHSPAFGMALRTRYFLYQLALPSDLVI